MADLGGISSVCFMTIGSIELYTYKVIILLCLFSPSSEACYFCTISESGRVFMFGPNDWGQLGIGPQKVANRPTCIKSECYSKGL